ncbi:MAG TPA: AtpZ/AtpI family protein [Candidatus Saccharimonadales bacterium]|nr:AtpZ/AtpI family protein [Candidatus Saccharimonadales bacterium]
MTKGQQPKEDADTHGDDTHAAIAILVTLADTTWRIFTPVILCTALGIWADLHFGTKPWLTLFAVALGFGLAILLVRAQLQKVGAMENKTR